MLVTIQTEHETLTYSGVSGYTLDFDGGILRMTQPKGQAYDGPSETDRADAWETRCAELEQELRDAQDRIQEQDVTIAKYDDENRELREKLCKYWEKPFPVSLNEWAKCIHENAVAHGWWETEDGKCDDGDRPFPEIVALCHSELSEALEEYRNGKLLYYPGENGKPEGVATEMIDCIIRILDWAAHEQVRVDDVMNEKVRYNEGRPYRHGGKKA